MGDSGSDTLAELSMLIEDYQRLQEKDPEHELLGLAELHEDKKEITFSVPWKRRFARERDSYKIQSYWRYREAMREAMGQRL